MNECQDHEFLSDKCGTGFSWKRLWESMRIAQVALPFLPVPPKGYGAVERIISCLTESLVSQGHDVTLFAPADSSTRAKLVPTCEESRRRNPDGQIYCLITIGMVARRFSDFDIIHFHYVDTAYLPIPRLMRTPSVVTFHGPISNSTTLQPFFREFSDVAIVPVSDFQKSAVPELNWQSTVYHGLSRRVYRLQLETEGYLAFLGRFSRHKGVHQAIQIARQSGRKLKIAGCPVTKTDETYYEAEVKPFLGDPLVEYVGELEDAEKQDFLGAADALLFPIEGPEEVFGLVMIEAMACGTPVIAYDYGPVREIVTDGVTGYVVNDLKAAALAASKIACIDRVRCRKEFEHRFSDRRMRDGYLKVYEGLRHKWPSKMETS